MKNMNTLDKLYKTILDRKKADPDRSYVAKLLKGGDEKIGRKITEEASEVLIAGIKETKKRVISESADLVFHLMVLWAKKGIKPEAIFDELEKRMGISGLDEKAARKAKKTGK
jgi:phosphoribosyl-ATP pyrophosphohydrolase